VDSFPVCEQSSNSPGADVVLLSREIRTD
jgi:hypothetical protein